MPISNVIISWIIYILLSWCYGALVQHLLGYERISFLITVSIGAVGILIAKYILPSFLNIHPVFHLGGVPLIASFIGSFIVPGLFWILRKNNFFNSNEKS